MIFSKVCPIISSLFFFQNSLILCVYSACWEKNTKNVRLKRIENLIEVIFKIEINAKNTKFLILNKTWIRIKCTSFIFFYIALPLVTWYNFCFICIINASTTIRFRARFIILSWHTSPFPFNATTNEKWKMMSIAAKQIYVTKPGKGVHWPTVAAPNFTASFRSPFNIAWGEF